jgi:hypothetical protein
MSSKREIPDELTIKTFLGKKIIYDKGSQMIFAVQTNGHCQMILDVRGWGSIQNKFKDLADAQAFQDDLAEFYCQAIQEKLSTL